MAEEFLDRKPPSVKVNISGKTRKYYEGEATVARNSSDPHHLNPVFPGGAKVICVGYGRLGRGSSWNESFRTREGIRRGLLLAGFSNIQFPKTEHGQFLVTARNRAPSAK
jgi:hypothetical protein